MAKWKCFDRDRRMQLEALYRAGHTKKEMAAILGCHLSTIYRELNKGTTTFRDYQYRTVTFYSASRADAITTQRRSNCGASLKLPANPQLADYIRRRIKYYKYSPAAIAAELRNSDLGYVCKDTIYRYIHKRYFDGLRMSDLPNKGKYKKKSAPRPVKPNRYGRSIELRPPEIAARSSFGHWEMDSVVGTRTGSASLLVLTERSTRLELVFKMPDRTAASVHRVMDKLRRSGAFGSLIRTITMDNGAEFASVWNYEKYGISCYYCHPFCSSERGSNENANRLIRRWYGKGESLRAVTASDVLYVVRWMNTYPRAILGWKNASQAFKSACDENNIIIPPYFSQFLS